jgi:hypothetical protein
MDIRCPFLNGTICRRDEQLKITCEDVCLACIADNELKGLADDFSHLPLPILPQDIIEGERRTKWN